MVQEEKQHQVSKQEKERKRKNDDLKPASNPVLKEKKEGHKDRKVDKEEVKSPPKVSKGKTVTAGESYKTSLAAAKKRDAVVLLDDEDDEDDRPYKKRLVGRNNVRPPLPPKLARSPKKKEDDDPTFSDYSKQSDDGTFSATDDDDPFASEGEKEDSTVCFLVYTMKCFL